MNRLVMRSYRDIILSEATYGGLPVLYHQDNGSSSPAVDEMTTARGTGFDGTYTGGYTLGVDGPINREASRSVLLNGTTGYIGCGNSSTLNPGALTVEAWVYLLSLPTAGNFVTVYDRTLAPVYTQFVIDSAGKIVFFSSTSGGSVLINASGASLSTNRWHYLVLTYDSSAGAKAYANGSVDSTVGPAGTLSTSSGNSVFGYGPDTNTRYLSGRLAHRALYNYALAADRVKAHYLAGVNGVPKSQLLRCG
jgi:hypothetical protein